MAALYLMGEVASAAAANTGDDSLLGRRQGISVKGLGLGLQAVPSGAVGRIERQMPYLPACRRTLP